MIILKNRTFCFKHQTPLHEAANNGFVECVNVLIKYGADFTAKNVRRERKIKKLKISQ